MPDTVKTIGDFAFYGTKALESINIPDSVTNIGTDAFGECSGLRSSNSGFCDKHGRGCIL